MITAYGYLIDAYYDDRLVYDDLQTKTTNHNAGKIK